MNRRRIRRLSVYAISAVSALLVTPTLSAAAGPAQTVNGFSYGQLQTQNVGAPGCGTNAAGEPSIHVSRDNHVVLGSEDGLTSGSQIWQGGSTSDGCGLTYAGQPNVIAPGTGASGGDIDTAIAPEKSASGNYRIYAASLNLGSVNVATSSDNGKTFTQNPVQQGLPLDDRPWIAAAGADTSLLTYHDIATNNIDVLRSDNGGGSYTQVSRAIPDGDYKVANNQLGNIVVDHRNPAPGGFRAYQSFAAPSTPQGTTNDEAFVSASADGGNTWQVKPISCSTAFGKNGLSHNFPNVSVAPDGSLFYAMSNEDGVYVAKSADHGDSWTCSGKISTTGRAIYPWIVATSAGEDLVYYGANGTGPNTQWSVYFAQNPTSSLTGWKNTQLMPVHKGEICEEGITCQGGRNLYDDFGIDTDQSGFAHIAYSHDSPDLGGPDTYTGYAVQTAGTPVGQPN